MWRRWGCVHRPGLPLRDVCDRDRGRTGLRRRGRLHHRRRSPGRRRARRIANRLPRRRGPLYRPGLPGRELWQRRRRGPRLQRWQPVHHRRRLSGERLAAPACRSSAMTASSASTGTASRSACPCRPHARHTTSAATASARMCRKAAPARAFPSAASAAARGVRRAATAAAPTPASAASAAATSREPRATSRRVCCDGFQCLGEPAKPGTCLHTGDICNFTNSACCQDEVTFCEISGDCGGPRFPAVATRTGAPARRTATAAPARDAKTELLLAGRAGVRQRRRLLRDDRRRRALHDLQRWDV